MINVMFFSFKLLLLLLPCVISFTKIGPDGSREVCKVRKLKLGKFLSIHTFNAFSLTMVGETNIFKKIMIANDEIY